MGLDTVGDSDGIQGMMVKELFDVFNSNHLGLIVNLLEVHDAFGNDVKPVSIVFNYTVE